MVIEQKFNRVTKRWVKFKVTSKGSKILDVKQRNPTKPFKGISKFRKIKRR